MSKTPIRAVFDCVVFVQGAGRRTNASRRCLELVDSGSVQLCLSAQVLAEIHEVLHRPELLRKFPLIESVDSQILLTAIRAKGVLFVPPSCGVLLPRDPDDQIYLDLAVASQAEYLVTWNERHLTYLMLRDTPEGEEFCRRYPQLKIVDPPLFLKALV